MEIKGLDILFILWICLCCGVGLLAIGLVLLRFNEEKLNPVSFEGLPEKNYELSNKEQGLYNKFEVYRRDGSDDPGGKHDGCSYFVLDLTHDEFALETAWYYAQACKAKFPLLSEDLSNRVREAYEQMDDEGRL